MRARLWPARLLTLFTLLTLLGAGQAGAADYPFTVPWNDAVASPSNVAGLVLDAPAGRHGAVIADGDRLVFADTGEAASFWGMVISVSRSFPPRDPQDADAVVAKLARYGFNFVRLNGIDFARVGLYAKWRDTDKLDDDWMQRFDYFVAALRKAGIYYAVSVNHMSGKYAPDGELPFNETAPRHKNYNVMQLVDDGAIRAAQAWYTAVLTHRNRYTGLTLLGDPAHVHLSAVGEDSVFNPWLRGWDRLPVPVREALRLKFNAFLDARYGDRARLKAAWSDDDARGLVAGEDAADGTVRLLAPEAVARYARRRAVDQADFFDALDRAYLERMTAHIATLGSARLYTGTNNWFGYANALANQRIGSVVETHGYLDHPTRAESADGAVAEAYLNASLLALTSRSTGAQRRALLKRNFYRLFTQSLDGMPVLVSEWNHTTWSDYSYEGAVFMTAYARLNGFRLLSVHTYFGAGQTHRAEHSSKGLASIGNAALFALSPSLSLAFTRGDVAEDPDPVTVVAAADRDALLYQTARHGLRHRFGDSGLPLDAGFVAKVRTRLIGPEATGTEALEKAPYRQLARAAGADALVSATREIVWQRDHAASRYLSVDAPRFQALVAGRDGADVALSGLQAALDDHGAVTAVSLDGKPLATSSSLLVTAVSSVRNTGFAAQGGSARRVVTAVGSAPTLLREVDGRIALVLSDATPVTVVAVAIDGEQTAVQASVERLPAGRQRVAFSPAGAGTPWFWVSR